MKSSHLITIALIAFICITGINGQARGRPTVASSGSSRMPTRNTAASQPTQAAASTPSAPVTSAGNHNQQPETFSVADLAGTHALKASGVVLVGGVGSSIVVSSVTYPTYPESLWISLEGRLCITEKGECALNAWVNVGGHTSIHLDTANPASTVPSGQACKVNVDEFGQGVAYVPVVLSADEGAMTSLPNFPSFIVIKFQAYDGGHSYFEIEGCGPAGTIMYSGPTYGLPGYAGSGATLLQYIQHVCTPSAVQDQGRRPISLTGESSRISFRCSNCKNDDFAWYGSDCNDICPWDSSSGHNNGRGGGPRVGRNNGGSTSDSLDN